MNEVLNRRSFFRLALMSTIAVPFIAKSAKIFAGEACPSVLPAGKQVALPGVGMGKTLEYVTDAKTSKNAKYKTGNNCANCKFYNTAKAEGGYAPCTMLGMKYVISCGWCKSYSVKV